MWPFTIGLALQLALLHPARDRVPENSLSLVYPVARRGRAGAGIARGRRRVPPRVDLTGPLVGVVLARRRRAARAGARAATRRRAGSPSASRSPPRSASYALVNKHRIAHTAPITYLGASMVGPSLILTRSHRLNQRPRGAVCSLGLAGGNSHPGHLRCLCAQMLAALQRASAPSGRRGARDKHRRRCGFASVIPRASTSGRNGSPAPASSRAALHCWA